MIYAGLKVWHIKAAGLISNAVFVFPAQLYTDISLYSKGEDPFQSS